MTTFDLCVQNTGSGSTEQIQEIIKKVSLCSAWADQCIAELENEKQQKTQAEASFAQKMRDELATCEEKMDKLLDLHLNGSLTQDEYTAKKNKLVLAKKELDEKLDTFERKSQNRFERMIAFIKELNHAENIALHKNPVAGRDFLKKISSNPRIADRTLVLDFKNAFKIAEKYHVEALCAEATSFNFAECKTWRCAFEKIRTDFAQNL